MNVGHHTSVGDDDFIQKLVQFHIIMDTQHQVTWGDPVLLHVTGSRACQIKDLRSQVFNDSGQEDWGSISYPLGVVALSEQLFEANYWEFQPRTG